MPRDQNHREVAVLQTVLADVQVVVVVDELQRAGDPVRIRRVEEETMLAGHLAVPVVLRMVHRLKAGPLGRLSLNGRAGRHGGATYQSKAQFRKKRAAGEHAYGVICRHDRDGTRNRAEPDGELSARKSR